MITLKELLGQANTFESLPKDHKDNLLETLCRMSKFRETYSLPMIVTSGYRTLPQHLAIYEKRNWPMDKIPMGSAHLKGCACDILDPRGSLLDYCYRNEALLEEIGLWLEVKDARPRTHFQIYAPASGRRFFVP